MKPLIIRIIAGIILTVSSAAGSGGDDILGIWNNEDGRAKIEIYHCGSHYCGKIVWLKRPEYPADDPGGMAGKTRVDRENPNPALRTRPVLGMQFMEGFTHDGAATWDKGSIYDPETGKTYRSKMTLASPQRLELRGYVGIPLFGRTSTWSR